MGKITRKRRAPEVKAKVALEAMKGEQTLIQAGGQPRDSPDDDCHLEAACRLNWAAF